MNLTLNIEDDFPHQDVVETINSAVKHDEEMVKYKIERHVGICGDFEEKYGMSSDCFMKKFGAGELGDEDDFFDWYASKKGLDILSKKLKILSEIRL